MMMMVQKIFKRTKACMFTGSVPHKHAESHTAILMMFWPVPMMGGGLGSPDTTWTGIYQCAECKLVMPALASDRVAATATAVSEEEEDG